MITTKERRDITLEQFNKLEAKVLTLKAAKEMLGKTILYTYPGCSENRQAVYEMTISKIVTEHEYAETQPMSGYESQAQYWDERLPKLAKESLNRYLILDENGNSYGVVCECRKALGEDSPFWCGDEFDHVYFVEA